MSTAINMIGLVIALGMLMFLAWKGLSIYLYTLICSVIIIVTNGLPFWSTFTVNFSAGVAGFFKSYFLLFTFSAAYAKVMGDTGAADSLAYAILSLTKKSKNSRFLTMVSLSCVNLIFTYAGISVFVITFLMTTIASKIYEELDIPWHLYCTGAWASGTVTMTMLPGSPQATNLIPMSYFGTTATAAPVLGIISSVVCVVLELLYVRFALNKALKKGQHFLPYGAIIVSRRSADDKELRHEIPLLLAITPSVVMLIVLNVPVFGNIPIFAMAVAIILSLILFYKHLPINKWNECLTKGFEQGIGVVAQVSMVVGFGQVVKASPAYSYVVTLLEKLPGSPLFQCVVIANVCAGVAGSSSGGLTIALDTFSEKMLTWGVDPQVLHRLSSMSAGGLDSLPHNATVMVAFKVQGLTHSTAYIHYFVECTVIPIFVTIFATILASMGVC